jgi:homoserine O-succinyltransferase
MSKTPIQVAILDMNDGNPNMGIDCLIDIITRWGDQKNKAIQYQVFDVRKKGEIPSLDFDIYLSSGGPGSPIESSQEQWDQAYTLWLDKILASNKLVLLICHSFQIACRHFNIGNVCLRKSKQIGVLPVHFIEDNPLFEGLQDPFYALESRSYQIIEPHDENLKKIGAKIIALEKHRPEVPLERALMGIQFSPYMYGVQFHPEGDPKKLIPYFNRSDVKDNMITEFGISKWQNTIDLLDRPETIQTTYQTFIPHFLDNLLK